MGIFQLRLSQETNKDLSSGTFIVLLNAESIPPHLLLSIDGSLYSITVAGQHTDGNLEKLLGLVERKKVPTLFVELKLPLSWNSEKLKAEARKNSARYERVEAGKTSCLFPIRDTVAAVYGNEMQQARFIFELFPFLEKQKAIGQAFAFHISKRTSTKSTFELLRYDESELKKAILEADSIRLNRAN